MFVSCVVVKIRDALPIARLRNTCGDYPSLMTITAMATKMMTIPISSTFNGIPDFLWCQLVDHTNPCISLGQIDKTDAPRMRDNPLQYFVSGIHLDRWLHASRKDLP